MSDPRVIKKYENRRLYDTEESRYVNLEEVAALIRGGAQIQVVDAKSGEDLTRHVMAQIIVEESRNDDGGPPLDFLRDLIKTQDQAQKDFLQWYLGTAADAYERVQESWRGPTSWPSPEKQKEAWARILDPFGAVRAVMRGPDRGSEGKESAEDAPEEVSEVDEDSEVPAQASPSDELADLKKRMQELEDRLS
jgi:polyhydroxyalkanoate synthesis repressor PhaR